MRLIYSLRSKLYFVSLLCKSGHPLKEFLFYKSITTKHPRLWMRIIAKCKFCRDELWFRQFVAWVEHQSDEYEPMLQWKYDFENG